MRDNCIPTIVWLDPILPFINDTEENIRGILSYCEKQKFVELCVLEWDLLSELAIVNIFTKT